jgi:hypothetical protein
MVLSSKFSNLDFLMCFENISAVSNSIINPS